MNNWDSWKVKSTGKHSPKITLLNFDEHHVKSILPHSRNIKKIFSTCRDCGDPLKRIESKISGICPMCDMK